MYYAQNIRMGYILLKGIFIGLLSSAPMGPVGMLCIQRTLNDGHRHGIVTGLGAAVGDIIFAIITVIGAFGLSFISEYIEKHQSILQIIGSVVLIFIGYFVYNQNPSKNISKAAKTQLPFGKVFASSLALTLSNIGMFFLYMALFARFKLIDSGSFGFSLLIVPAIGIGALLWWIFVSYIVDRLRTKLNPRGLKLFNKVVGTILVSIAVVGIISGLYMKINASSIF